MRKWRAGAPSRSAGGADRYCRATPAGLPGGASGLATKAAHWWHNRWSARSSSGGSSSGAWPPAASGATWFSAKSQTSGTARAASAPWAAATVDTSLQVAFTR